MRPAKEFERELEMFRWEVDAGTQFFYAWLGLHATIGKNEKVRNLLDDAALFWNTTLYALQAQTFIVLSRVFDQDKKSKHNIDKLLRMGEGRILRKLQSVADQVNALEEDFVALTDAELRALTDTYRERLEDGETLDDLMPEAFATTREAAKRTDDQNDGNEQYGENGTVGRKRSA